MMDNLGGERVNTGIPGLDRILNGGLVANRAYMVRGGPGSGKTMLGEHFLTAAADEDSLFVSLEESAENLESNAASVGLDLSDITILDYSPEAERFADDASYDVFAPGDRGQSLSEDIKDAVDEHEPDRVFVDPLTQLRQYAVDDDQFRQEVRSFTTYVHEKGATLLFTTQPTAEQPDDDLEFISDGSIELGESAKGRTITIRKLRGSGFQRGDHTVRITDEGFHVYPQLVPNVRNRKFDASPVSSGVDALDDMLHGGIEPGTVTVISGPSGVGKTTTATQFATAAADRGGNSVAYLFEEAEATFMHRSETIGMPVREMAESGALTVNEVEPLSVSPDEFAANVREAVETDGARLVVIDGISGYRLSIRGEEDDLVRELHALCRYLRGMGVTVLLVDDVPNVTGAFQATSERISYLADNIIYFRYLEHGAEIRKAGGILKKRSSDFERTLREFEITSDGLRFGEPLRNLTGILSGSPERPTTDG